VLLAGLAGCAAPHAEPEFRVVVKLVRPSSDSAAIERLVASRAGVGARYAGSISLVWHTISLQCGAAAECETALQRLQADKVAFEVVQRDERKRIVSP